MNPQPLVVTQARVNALVNYLNTIYPGNTLTEGDVAVMREILSVFRGTKDAARYLCQLKEGSQCLGPLESVRLKVRQADRVPAYKLPGADDIRIAGTLGPRAPRVPKMPAIPRAISFGATPASSDKGYGWEVELPRRKKAAKPKAEKPAKAKEEPTKKVAKPKAEPKPKPCDHPPEKAARKAAPKKARSKGKGKDVDAATGLVNQLANKLSAADLD